MIENRFKIWIFFSILSFWVVSAVGTLMRYKIGFEFPFFYQKYLLHAHSHFAFAGWVTQTLMILMVYSIREYLTNAKLIQYQRIFGANLVVSYGMLIFFTIQGYGLFSITFSTLSILTLLFFTYLFIKDLINNDLVNKHLWFIAALFFNFLSIFGTAKLIHMMATKQIVQDAFLASIYWYLHFQYNGWFFFAFLGLFIYYLEKTYGFQLPKKVFYLLAAACIPTYGLSLLWANLPLWIYCIVAAGAVVQVYAWGVFSKKLVDVKLHIFQNIFESHKLLLIVALLASTTKFLLQFISIVPEISKLAFGFRPIIIAYLHLALLAMTSMFLLYLCLKNKLLENNHIFRIGVFVVITGVLLNELVLLIQGLASLEYLPLDMLTFTNESLFGISALIFIGIAQLIVSQVQTLKSS